MEVTDQLSTSQIDYWLFYNGRWGVMWRNIWTDERGCYACKNYPSSEYVLSAWVKMILNGRASALRGVF